MQITIRQLQIIEAIVDTRSYSLAAEKLHMTQPAVSMQMKQLEHNIGLTLFERQGKRVALTTAGQAVHEFSCDIAAKHESLIEAIHQIKDYHSGKIKVSAATTANHLITQMIAKFYKMDNTISVVLDITNREQLVNQLQGFVPDLVIMGEAPSTLDVESQKLIPNPLVMIAEAHHPLAKEANIPFSTIKQNDFIIREKGSGTRAAIKRFFAERDATLKSTLEMASNEAIKYAVIAGLGLGIVSLHTIKLELESGLLVLLDVEDFPLERYWYIVKRKGKHLLPAVKEFEDFIQEEAKMYASDYDRFLESR